MPRTAVHVAGTALLITLCTLGLGAPTVHAEHHEGSHTRSHGERKAKDPATYAAKLTEKLGLSEEQSTQVTAIIEEHHAKIKPLKDQIKALFEQMKPLKEQIGELKQAKHGAIKAVLTLEQQVQFAEMGSKKRGHQQHGPDVYCEYCALKKSESSESEEE